MIWNRNKGDRNNGELIRRRIVFYGWVQGVGFRWRALQAANDLGVTGWVRNDPSGSVTMEAQGTQEAIDGVIVAIKQSPHISIDRMEIETIPLKEGERSFQPVYGW